MNAQEIASDVAKTISNLTRQTSTFRNTVIQLRGHISALEAERREIESKPLAKEDWLNICLAQVDQKADEHASGYISYFRHEAASIYGVTGQLYHSVAQAHRVARGEMAGHIMPLSAGLVRTLSDGPLSEDAVWFLFRDQVKDGIKRAFEQMTEWPFPDAKPAASYFPRLEALAVELAQLREQEKELVSQARQLGIGLPD